jgi:hypothetical protein
LRNASEEVAIARRYPPTPESWESRHELVRGWRYHVIKKFIDADGDKHPVGESWILICAMFSKFDGEIQFSVNRGGGGYWMFPLSWDKEKQADLIENITSYIEPT